MNTADSISRVTRALAILAASASALRAAAPAAAATSAPAPVNAVIDAGKTFAPINPNLYGMFIEHAGGLVYRGMWAEMIDDRKFFNRDHRRDPGPGWTAESTPRRPVWWPTSPVDSRRPGRIHHHGRPARLCRRPLSRDRAELQ